ncbi:MAG: site-specific integrase [Deltaproteobacteria bacterium]|jgi:integrase|nr:site-specific integrase [Deltaproteobacteria bacterium]
MNLYKRGNIWWCKFRVDNILYQYSCKTKDKSVAQEVAAALNADVVRRKFDIPTKYKKVTTFKDVYEEYLKSISNSKDWTQKKTSSFLKHFLLFFTGNNIKAVDLSNIRAYQLQRKLEILSMPKNIGKKESEISFKSINLEIAVLRHFFNYCIERGYLDKNPAAGIKKLNELSRLKTLSDEDIQKLIAGATNKLTRDLISFLILTGCRKGEALNLKWDDVDLQNGVIAIKGTKTKYDRYIPISDALRGVLRGINKNQDSLYVFNRNGAKLGNFRKSFMTACRNAGLKDLRIHDLRHVFASKMVMNGTSLYITGELLGHRTTQMTKRYSHLVPDTLKKAVDAVFGKKD